MILEQDKDTIAAVSTAPGTGGIAVLRVSGSQALTVVRKLAFFLPKDVESHRVYYGELKDSSSGEPIDEVLIAFFAEGRSFTGETTLEISCHGGRVVTQEILDNLVRSGARLATRGEFSYRAFINGRLDLVQAEAILSLIESQSKDASRMAFRQLRGSLSGRLNAIEDRIVWTCANLEANIDFAQEDIEVVANSKLRQEVETALNDVVELESHRARGRYLRKGFHVCLVGRPNVGKSSLFNALLEEDRALISEQPGTTRDYVEGKLLLAGVEVVLVDTAGLRVATDMIESLGIEKTLERVREADLVLFVLGDCIEESDLNEIAALSKLSLNQMIFIKNKADIKNEGSQAVASLLERRMRDEFGRSDFFCTENDVVFVSAKVKQGLQQVTNLIERRVLCGGSETSEVTLSARQGELLGIIKESLVRGLTLIEKGESPEFVAMELNDSVRAIHEILGKVYDDQVVDRVFKEFCLGK